MEAVHLSETSLMFSGIHGITSHRNFSMKSVEVGKALLLKRLETLLCIRLIGEKDLGEQLWLV